MKICEDWRKGQLFLPSCQLVRIAYLAATTELLSNDDGIYAPGLRAMYKTLSEAGHHVIVVAPASEQSGVSCSLHMRDPLRVQILTDGDFIGRIVDGTPVDCMKMALTTLMPELPDLVVVGLNAGSNMGTDVFYSGTIGAASEAALQGLPVITFSRPAPELEPPLACARHAARLVSAIDWTAIPIGRVLNVNYPRRIMSAVRGVRFCRMSTTCWAENYIEREDPSGRPYWWISGYQARKSGGDDTDIAMLREGYVTITPLRIDRTDYDLLSRMQRQFPLD